MSSSGQSTITFKVEEQLAQSLRGIPNRSAFIRNAILSALGNLCPLCQGSGVLDPGHRQHWEKIRATHPIEQCGECGTTGIVCKQDQ